MQMPSKPARSARDAAVSGAGWLWRTSRQHWVMSALLLAGLVLRVITQIAYRPALFYIDTLKYLFNAFPGTDPVGYKVPLYPMVFFGGLPGVAAAQHLLGLAMAVGLYVLLLRRGCARWLAALAAAPLLLDAYQLQIEQMIMPDVWFEAAILGALMLLLWHRRDPRPPGRRLRRLRHPGPPAQGLDHSPVRGGLRRPHRRLQHDLADQHRALPALTLWLVLPLRPDRRGRRLRHPEAGQLPARQRGARRPRL